ncbi:MAG: Thermolysin metallopeptidase alpha-helical domain [Solirubrobacterales bacterium]|nr:Thermolysin metallopeptidase alpha-helical domain [Solirubrobacterales bacterium]
MRRALRSSVVAVALCAALPASAHAAGGTAPAKVFFPNPVQSLQNEGLTDLKDADFFSADPLLRTAYTPVTLTDLDASGTLTGTYAKVISETGTPARRAADGFAYTRDDDRFEQVMGYFWVTQAQRYLQGLKLRRPANARQQLLRINQYGGDNSFYREGSSKLTITLGKGGVDDAEDGEVIVHEYGHAVQDDQVPGFGSSPEAGAIGEAFGDYLSVEVSNAVTGNTFQQPCVADWDSVSYTPGPIHCLRRIDGTKHYPEDVRGEVHADGELWSAALWQARQAIGDPLTADRIIVNAQFDFTPGIGFKDAALKTIAAAGTNTKAAQAFRTAFTARGFMG